MVAPSALSWSEHPCPLVCRRSTTSAATPGRSRRARRPSRSSRAWRCRCRRSHDDFVRREIVGRVEGIAEDGAPACSRCASRSPRRPSAAMPGSSSTCCSATRRCTTTWCCTMSRCRASWCRCFGGPRHGLAGIAPAGRRAGAGFDLLGAQAARPACGPARRARAALCARRHRLHQGRSRAWPTRPIRLSAERVEAVAAALRAAPARRQGRALCAEPDGRSRRHARPDRRRARRRHRHRDGRADDRRVCPISTGWCARIPRVAFLAHPTMAGAARIAPPFLLGKLFRMLGADAVVFPNHGGRFGYSPDTCRALARAALNDAGWLAPLRAGAGRRHDAPIACRRCLISMAPTSCC